MAAVLQRTRPSRTVERGFVQTRQERQLVVAAYQLAVPLIQRRLASARPACYSRDACGARQGQAKVAAGGSC